MDLAPENLLDDRLRIKKRLGEGGFGTVYEALDEHLNRTVAVKVLKESLMNDASIRKRFLREGKILAAVHSEFLVRLFSVNISAEGFLYMVMELVTGKSLRQELNDKTRLHDDDTLRVANGVAMALKALDSNGVVHRDLKPDNIMLVPESDSFAVKVLDFGLSALVDKVSVKDSYVTDSGTMLGSVHYIAPELCIGERASFQSDCYALGCLLYECAVGEPPFSSGEPAAIVFRQVSEQPADPELLVPSLGKGLRQLIIQLLQKDPATRYQSADELLAAIDTCIAGNTPESKSGTVYSAAPSPKNRNRSSLLPLAVIAILLVAALGTYVYSRKSKSSIASDIPVIETGGSHILSLAEKVHAEEPSEALTYFECMRLLETDSLPAATRTTMQAKLAECDGRINKYTRDLVTVLTQKRDGLSKAQFAAIAMAAGRLGRIRHEGQSQAILAAGLQCICEGLRSAPDKTAGFDQLAEMLVMYDYSGPVDRVVLDRIASVICLLPVSTQARNKDVALEMELLHGYSSHHLRTDKTLRKRLLLSLNSAPIELIRKHRGTIREMMTEAAKEKDAEVARHLAYLAFRGDKEASRGAELAQLCYLAGNTLQGVDDNAAFDFWSKAIRLYKESPRKNEHYVAALSNAATYCIHNNQLPQAREFLWRAYNNLAADFPVSDSLKLNWLHVAVELPTPVDQMRICQIATDVANQDHDSKIVFSDINERTDAAYIALSSYRTLCRFTEADTLGRKWLQAAQREHANPEAIFRLQSEYQRILVCKKDPKSVAYQEQLIANVPKTLKSRQLLATMYQALAHYQKLFRSAPQVEKKDPSMQPYFATEQRGLELRGFSPSFARRYCKMDALFLTTNHTECAHAVDSILNDTESCKLSPGEVGALLGAKVERLRLSGELQTALAAADEALHRTNTSATLCAAAATTFLAAGRFERARDTFETYLNLKRVDSTWSRKYADTQEYLYRSQPAKSEARFRELVDSASRNLTPIDLVQFNNCYALTLASTGKTEEARCMLTKLQPTTPMDDWSYKRHLSLLFELSGQQEKALELTKRLIAAPEFFARDPIERDNIRADLTRLEKHRASRPS